MTRSPIDVEEALDGLKIRLSHPTMPAHRLVEALFFLTESLGQLPRPEMKRPFVDDVLRLLEPVGERVDLDGISPELLEQAALALGDLPLLNDDAARLRHRLLAWAVVQFHRLSDGDGVRRILGLDISASVSGDVLQYVRINRPALADGVEMATSKSTQDDAHDKNRATGRFPVVADAHHGATGRSPVGLGRRLSCTVSGFGDGPDTFSLLFEHAEEADSMLRGPLGSARTLLDEVQPGLLKKTYAGSFELNANGGLHSGQSAGLAMALLLFCEIHRFTEQRTTYRIHPDCMLTGAVGPDGVVLPVDDETLDAKVDAAFFSDAALLVLPDGQLDAAKRRRDLLLARYPNRHLMFRGIAFIQEALADRRIVVGTKRNWFLHQLTRFLNRRWLVLATVIGIMAGGSAVWWVENQVDPNPASWTVEDSAYVVKNGDGRVIFRYDTQNPTNAIGNWGDQYTTAELIDIDADGRLDFVFLVPRSEGSGRLGALGVWNATTSSVQMHSVFTLQLPYPKDLSILHGRMAPRALIAGDFDADGRVEAYVSALQDFYPSVIMKIDVTTGTVLDTYHHSGALRTLMNQDLDGDGRHEILAGGTNNAFDQAVLVVLDARHIGGYGPSQGDYQPGTGPTGHEKVYLRMPRSELGVLLPNAYPRVDAMRRMPQDSLIAFQVNEARSSPTSTQDTRGSLHVTADDSLRLVSVGSSDGYDFIWNQARQLGLNPAPLDNAFKIKYMQGVERWTPDGWVPQPISPRSKAWGLMRNE